MAPQPCEDRQRDTLPGAVWLFDPLVAQTREAGGTDNGYDATDEDPLQREAKQRRRFGGIARGGFIDDHLSSSETSTIGQMKVTTPTTIVVGTVYPSPSRATMAL